MPWKTPSLIRVWTALIRWLPAILLVGLLPSLAAAGSLQTFKWHSAALGKEQLADVYVPAGEPPDEGWPVLYLLHGLHGARHDFTTLGGITVTLDRLIAAHRIRPLVVVMPDGNDSWYVDSAEVGGPGNYATALSHELPQAIEAAFPVDDDADDRAVAGISMGGFGALRFALGEPGRYSAVAALSPAVWQNIPETPVATGGGAPYFRRLDPDTVTVGIDLPPDGKHFGAAFGTPFDPRRFNAANVFTLLQDAVEAKRKLPAVFLSVGDDDSHNLWRGAIALFETMQANMQPVEFRVTNGDHNWTLWKATLADALQFVDAHLGRPAIR